MVKPSGSIHWRRTKPPGWGGFFIGMVGSPSVAIVDPANPIRDECH
jgi:hypothetical protein